MSLAHELNEPYVHEVIIIITVQWSETQSQLQIGTNFLGSQYNFFPYKQK